MQSYQRFQHIVHTVFNTSGTNGPCSLSWAKAGTHATPALSRAHSGLHGETGGVLGGGGITTLGAFHTVRKPCAAGCQNGILCRFWVLTGCAHKEHREPLGQRCAHARRCSEGVAAPLGCVIFLLLSKLRPVRPIPDTSFGFPDAPACAVPVQTLSQLVPFRLGAVQGFSVLSLRSTSFFENGDKKGRHLFAHCDQSTV